MSHNCVHDVDHPNSCAVCGKPRFGWTFQKKVRCEMCGRECEPLMDTDMIGVLAGRFCSRECLDTYVESK